MMVYLTSLAVWIVALSITKRWGLLAYSLYVSSCTDYISSNEESNMQIKDLKVTIKINNKKIKNETRKFSTMKFVL